MLAFSPIEAKKKSRATGPVVNSSSIPPTLRMSATTNATSSPPVTASGMR
jgi:hypothetical protein